VEVLDDRGGARHDAVRAHRWSGNGPVKVLGDVDVGSASLTGPVSVRGKLQADEFTVIQDSDFEGKVWVRQALTLAGEARMGSDLAAGELRVRGRLRVNGPVRVDRQFHLEGRLEGTGDLTVGGAFDFDGEIHVTGLLRAGSVVGRLRQESFVGEIFAPSVRIVRHGGFGAARGVLETLRIEAAEAHLEGVRCQYVRADRVTLGADCHISRVDGTILSQHRSSQVGPQVKFERLHGMFR
jgi:cytoskeletal protein CcmA (bactofilin family)